MNLRIKITILLLALITASAFAVFFGDTVHTVHIYFEDPDFWESLDSTYETEEYMMCSVIFDAVDTLDSVGIRLKGHSSYSHPGNKKPFHLKFDEYIDDVDYRNNERISFNNCFKDPTFLREKLATEIFHGLGAQCPRACWSVVYYNDEYWGFYSTIDPINKDAMSRFFGENDCNLYKGEPRGTLLWLGWSADSYRNNYEKSTNEDEDDWNDLIDFINFLNNSSDTDFDNEILEWFDAIGFARMCAANSFMVNLDSYVGPGHNFYLYFDSDTVGRYIAQDLNMAFGSFNQYDFTPNELRELDIDWYNTGGPPGGSGRPLVERCFDDYSPFWDLVYCAIHELMETTLDTVTFNARVTELADLVRPYVYADVNKQYSNTAFELNLDVDITSGTSTCPGLRDFVMDRYEYLESVIEPCDRLPVERVVLINEVMADNDAVIADEEGEFDDWFEIYNPSDTAVDLSYWWLSDDVTEPRKWSFPNGTVIPADGYLLVWADSDPEQGDLHTSFKLDADGEELALFGSDFIGAQLCDSTSWVSMLGDSSWGRFPNGSATWLICLVATPEAENTWGTIVVANANGLPERLTLSTYPNPFNSAVRIAIDGAELESGALIEIFDIGGRRIEQLEIGRTGGVFGKDETYSSENDAALAEIVWRPEKSIPSGVYLVRASIDADQNDQTFSRRIVYMK